MAITSIITSTRRKMLISCALFFEALVHACEINISVCDSKSTRKRSNAPR